MGKKVSHSSVFGWLLTNLDVYLLEVETDNIFLQLVVHLTWEKEDGLGTLGKKRKRANVESNGENGKQG